MQEPNAGMRPRIFFIAVLLAACCLLPPQSARATDEALAAKMIQTLGEKAFSTLQRPGMTLEEREAAFGQILREGFDLNLIARFVLGKYWRQASDEQRDDYVRAFTEFVITTYSRRLGGFTGQSFEIVGTKHSGEKKDVLVSTKIDRPSGPPIQAAWRVRETDGKAKIIDVVVEGVSMAVTQRQEFAAVAKRSGIEGLVQVLRAQTQRMAASSG